MILRPLSLLEDALLGLILIEPRSGYDLRKVFAETPMGHYSDSTGAIYPALKRLEKAGLIRGRVDDHTPMRPRRVFRLTPAGRAALKTWLTAPITEEILQKRSHELDLRLAFMDNLLPPREVAEFLTRWRTSQRTYVRTLDEYFAACGQGMTASARAALTLGVEQQRARLRWLGRVITTYQEENRKCFESAVVS